ncbi:hypothetical protein ACKWTF_009849 [Chironomus riparius]
MAEKENEVFLKKPLLDRTPKRSRNSNQITPTSSTQTSEKSINKRDLENITLADLFLLIESKSENHSKKLDELSINLGNDIANFKAEINQKMDGSLQNINNKIDIVEEKADQSLRIAMESQKLCVNYMKQARLDCCMDISGLLFNDVNTDLKLLAVNTIRSFKIKVDDADIKKVTATEIKKPMSKTILTVTFDDVETKMRIMREKSKIKINNGIFFNYTLTPSNGYYLRKAKYITKAYNIRPNFYDGAVHVKIPNGNSLIIQSEENLKELKKFFDEQPTNANEDSPQQMDVVTQ